MLISHYKVKLSWYCVFTLRFSVEALIGESDFTRFMIISSLYKNIMTSIRTPLLNQNAPITWRHTTTGEGTFQLYKDMEMSWLGKFLTIITLITTAHYVSKKKLCILGFLVFTNWHKKSMLHFIIQRNINSVIWHN